MPHQSLDNETVQVALLNMQNIFRTGLQSILESEPSLTLVADAANLEELQPQLDEQNVDVVVVGIDPGGEAVLDDVRRLAEKNPDLAPVVFATSTTPGLRASLLAGARGYLDGELEQEDIIDALRVAGRGNCLQVPAKSLLQALRGLPHSANPESSRRKSFARLTKRELAILEAMSTEETYGRIAARLGLAPSSVKKYAHSVITKLGARSRSTAVIQAYRNGLLKA